MKFSLFYRTVISININCNISENFFSISENFTTQHRDIHLTQLMSQPFHSFLQLPSPPIIIIMVQNKKMFNNTSVSMWIF